MVPQKTYTELEEDPPQDDMKSLGLFMDAVPFQTLSTIADGLEQRLDNLASAMFEPLVEEADLDTRSEVSSNRGGRSGGGDGSGTPGLDDSSPSRSSIRKADRGSVAFMTAVDVESPGSRDGTGVPRRSAMPIKSVEDVRVDYDKLLRGPMAPPNCEPALLMQSVSDEIEFPKQWMRDAWNTHFMSPLSVSIMQDLYWWYFNDEFALILNTLGEDNFGATPLEPSKQHKQAQAVMFNRISDCYTRMFWKVGLTMLTDDFFERYAQALADTVRVAFDRGLEESQYLFEENAGSRDTKLRDLVVQWTTAISPRRANTSKVRSGKRNIRCGKFDAVGHSPLMTSYMKRHGCVAPIGGASGNTHNLQRLEVELREDKVKWYHGPKERPAVAKPTVVAKEEKRKTKKPDNMPGGHGGTVLPSITDTCGMGAFSQKKVDECILGFLDQPDPSGRR